MPAPNVNKDHIDALSRLNGAFRRAPDHARAITVTAMAAMCEGRRTAIMPYERLMDAIVEKLEQGSDTQIDALPGQLRDGAVAGLMVITRMAGGDQEIYRQITTFFREMVSCSRILTEPGAAIYQVVRQSRDAEPLYEFKFAAPSPEVVAMIRSAQAEVQQVYKPDIKSMVRSLKDRLAATPDRDAAAGDSPEP